MSMVVASYPLWIVWDEVYPATLPGRNEPTRQSYYARVIGWRELPDPDNWSPSLSPTGPYPVVIHPDTQLPATLGHDGPGPVSRMWVTEDVHSARLTRDQRRTEHGGAR